MPNQESPLPKLDSLVISIRSALQGKLDSKVGTTVYEQHTQDNVSHITAAERTAWNNKVSTADYTQHTQDSVVHVTAAERAAWNGKADSSHTHTAEDITGLSNALNMVELSDTDIDNAMAILIDGENSINLGTVEEIGNTQTVEANNAINVNEVIEEDPDDGTDIDNVTTAETASTYDNV